MSSDPVAPQELLSRFILYRDHIRTSNNTVKPQAFMPHPHEDLSVTRHLDLDQEAIWSIGEDVAQQRERRLYGQAVNQASTYMEQKLKVLPAPIIPENPNHANVTGWPPDKEAQKMLAILIADVSEYMPRQ